MILTSNKSRIMPKHLVISMGFSWKRKKELGNKLFSYRTLLPPSDNISALQLSDKNNKLSFYQTEFKPST